MPSNLSGGLKDAFENYGKSGEAEPGSQQEPENEKKDTADLHSVHHLNHKESGKHSVHHMSHDGTAKSSTHDAGQGGETCPLCGGTGVEPEQGE